MSVTWSLIREQIVERALQKCGVLAVGESATADDQTLCLQALDSILKNLVWQGYNWPSTVAGSTTISITTQTTNLPADFYSANGLSYMDTGSQEHEIPILPFDQWRDIPKKTDTATYPRFAYIDNFNTLYIYPVPTAAVSARLYYQKVIDDTTQAAQTALESPWMMGLVYGVAAEVADEFEVPQKKIQRFEAKWREQLALGVSNNAPPSHAYVSVCD
jgi:hypothetical protein